MFQDTSRSVRTSHAWVRNRVWPRETNTIYDMAECDLTSKLGGYLDRHLVFPMLEFLSEKRVSGTWSGGLVDLVARDSRLAHIHM